MGLSEAACVNVWRYSVEAVIGADSGIPVRGGWSYNGHSGQGVGSRVLARVVSVRERPGCQILVRLVQWDEVNVGDVATDHVDQIPSRR